MLQTELFVIKKPCWFQHLH